MVSNTFSIKRSTAERQQPRNGDETPEEAMTTLTVAPTEYIGDFAQAFAYFKRACVTP